MANRADMERKVRKYAKEGHFPIHLLVAGWRRGNPVAMVVTIKGPDEVEKALTDWTPDKIIVGGVHITEG